MARKRRWIKFREGFKTLDEFHLINQRVTAELIKFGLTKSDLTNKKAVWCKLSNYKIDGWTKSSITHDYLEMSDRIAEDTHIYGNLTYIFELEVNLNEFK